ncbi:MAG: gliding motility-associated C-terminal domain-containing protein [Ferruginibacter sp.]
MRNIEGIICCRRRGWLRLLLIYISLAGGSVYAQCPENIDFETGFFSKWDCDTGTIINFGGLPRLMLGSAPPTINRHVMLSAADNDGNDFYGGFPKNCPNGSGHSIRLGNDIAKQGAERVSYTFTIPASRNTFSLIYNYAVVFQDPDHLPAQQPRLSIEVMNLTDNIRDTCSSFDFVSNGSLPGFQVSPHAPASIPVLYKPWSAASINLDGKAGKTFRISFTTTDCLLGDHFGYAYIDINSECNSALEGTVFCPADPFVKLTAPPGFEKYRWFNRLNASLGSERTITVTPVPHGGDTLFVELTPFDGYGCLDTLEAYLWDTLRVTADAGADKEFCLNTAIRLGTAGDSRLLYTWLPETGLDNSAIANPRVLSPSVNTLYTLTVTSPGGGCTATDQVNLVKKCYLIDVFVPAAFTPNGDGLNDLLRPVLYGYNKLNYFRVYDRYGRLLFATNQLNAGWNGMVKGKAIMQQTLVWMLEAVDAYGRTDRRQGTAVLLR